MNKYAMRALKSKGFKWAALVFVAVSLLSGVNAVKGAKADAATSKTQYATCSYKLSKSGYNAYASISGSKLESWMCTPLMKYFGGGYTRWFGSMPGRQYGAWRNGELGLTFRLYAKEAWIGEYLSKYMSQHPMGSGWYRSA